MPKLMPLTSMLLHFNVQTILLPVSGFRTRLLKPNFAKENINLFLPASGIARNSSIISVYLLYDDLKVWRLLYGWFSLI